VHYLFADVSVSPTSAGMPGADIGQQLINWLGQVALWGSLASLLLGAAVYGLATHGGNYNGAAKGRQLVTAGAIGALLTGIAPQMINVLYRAAGGA
jgi:hypothetical protein